MFQGAKIISTGSAIPSSTLTNHDISQIVETSDDWIFTRTGIKERRFLEGNKNSIINLAVSACKKALSDAFMHPSTVDLIILATSSPDDLFGSASKIQHEIGAVNAVAFDLTAACSGFVISMITALQFLQTGAYNNVLVIGADALSKWTDWSDRSTCILFGDAAGVAVLQSCSSKSNSILGFQLNTNGNYSNYLSIAYQPNTHDSHKLNLYQGRFKYISMNGKEVYKFAIFQVPLSIMKCLKSINMSVNEVDWLLLHQANKRILNAIAEKLSISNNKIISNLSKYGNTSAASIPLALDEAVHSKTISKGDIIVIAGFGAGLTWGTIVIRW
uniref:Beta-ketoacyl-[acyl-carrier-protein] synthase III n=1 Tax=Polysiphonia sp. TaxID=1967842 RepID=A0A1Z1MTY2_9FLOR|nr:Beta-ketoacyl-acyl carrier protein synthase III [Polysiphonia sp.]